MAVALVRLGACAGVVFGSALGGALEGSAQAPEWPEMPELIALHAERGRAVFQRGDGTLVAMAVGSVDAESGLLLRQVGDHVALLIQQAATDPRITRRVRIELNDGNSAVQVLFHANPDGQVAAAQSWVIDAVEAP